MLFLMLVIWVGSAMALAAITYFLFTRAVVFARGVVAAFMGFVLSQQYSFLVPTSGFLNCIAWIIICISAIYILSMLPRLDIAIRFLCTFFVSLIGLTFFIPAITQLLYPDLQITAAIEIFLKVICLAISVVGIILQGKKLTADFGSNIFIRTIDRLLASVLYCLISGVLIAPIYGQWTVPDIVYDVLLIVTIPAAFVADIFLANKLFFGYTPPQKIDMPK